MVLRIAWIQKIPGNQVIAILLLALNFREAMITIDGTKSQPFEQSFYMFILEMVET